MINKRYYIRDDTTSDMAGHVSKLRRALRLT